MNTMSVQSNLCLILLFLLTSFGLVAQSVVVPNQYYVIEIYGSNKVLDIYGASQDDGARIVVFDRHNGDNQLFQFLDVGNGLFNIRTKHSNKCIEVRNSDQQEGAIVQQWSDTKHINQRFRLVPALVQGYYYLVANHSNKKLAAASITNGSYIEQRGEAYNDWSMFRFIPQNPKEAQQRSNPPPAQQPTITLSAPVLKAPANGITLPNTQNSTWRFEWNPVANATDYQIYVQHKNQKDRLFNYLVKEHWYTYTVKEPVTTQLTNDEWYWWVRAVHGETKGPWSSANTFRIGASVTATIPQLVSPVNNSTLPNGSPNGSPVVRWMFDWADVPNASAYGIEVFHPAGPTYVVNTSLQTSYFEHSVYQSFPNEMATNWNWRIRALVNGTWSGWSETRTFNVQQQQIAIPAPVLISPVAYAKVDNGTYDGARGLDWSFKWNPVQGASQYQFHIGYSSGSTHFETSVNTTSYRYYEKDKLVTKTEFLEGWLWKVRAQVNGVWSAWSTVHPFSVKPATETIPNKNVFGDAYYRVRSAYNSRYMAWNSEVYSDGRSVNYGPTNLVIEHPGDKKLVIQFESISPQGDLYRIKVYDISETGTPRLLDLMSHNLRVEGFENPWRIQSVNGFYKLFIDGTDQCLEVVNGQVNGQSKMMLGTRQNSSSQSQLFDFQRY